MRESDTIKLQLANAEDHGISPRGVKRLKDDLAAALKREAAAEKAAEEHPDVPQMRAQVAALTADAAALPVGDEHRDQLEASAAAITADIARLSAEHTAKRAAEAEAAKAKA